MGTKLIHRMLVLFMIFQATPVVAGDDPTTHPNPLPISVVRPDHPRIWFNSDNVHLLKSRWYDPRYAEVVEWYEKATDDPIALALQGLARRDPSMCVEAVSIVGSEYSPEGGGPYTGFVDPISLVFDWCYPYLTGSEKADLVSRIKSLRYEHKNHPSTGIRSQFQWHGNFLFSTFAYLASVLAIEGEPGVVSELSQAQNVLQNLQELGDEVSADGGYRAYFDQGTIQVLPFLMWGSATDTDFAGLSGFTRNLSKWAVYRLAPSGNGSVRGPGDDVAFASGFTRNHLAPGGFFLLASHFEDPVARWYARLVERELTQHSPLWQFGGPAFLSLVSNDPDEEARSPGDAGLPLDAHFETIGMVHTRSTWNPQRSPVHAWFYNGPATIHSGETQNHFTIWRDDDPLIIKGGNYLGSPSTYHSHYYQRAISNNTLIFPPIGSQEPDHEGGQTRRWANLDLSREVYPVADRVGSWIGQHMYSGSIVHYESAGRYVIVSGDATLAYDPAHVTSYVRDFVYFKPDLFLIRDRFETTGVESVRSLIHTVNRPDWGAASRVIEGSDDAGIIETEGDRFQVRNGASSADVRVLWPLARTLRFVGGVGFEGYADGYNSDPYSDCQDWLKGHPQLPERVELIEGQWRVEIRVSPAFADGNLLTAIVVSDLDPDETPVYSLRQSGDDLLLTVTSGQQTWSIVFPPNAPPSITSAFRTSQPPRRLAPLHLIHQHTNTQVVRSN